MRAPNSGFTMVELMVVLAVLAVLATLAAPSFNQMIEGERIKGAANDLYAGLSLARSEAIKKNASMNLTANAAADWTQGWKVLDPNTGNDVADYSAVRGNLSIATSPAPLASVIYRSSGRLQAGGTASFSISGISPSTARCVCVSLSGRPSVVAGACTVTSC